VAVVVLSLLAAVVFGTAVAVQNREAGTIDARVSLRPGLLVALARRPLWLIGLGGDIGGFALQTAALAYGSIVVVQPLLTLGLVVSLGVGARLSRRHLLRWEWTAVAGVIIGLVVFYVAARPTPTSRAVASANAWRLTMAVVIMAVALMLVLGLRSLAMPKVVLFAIATAGAEAVMAVISKAFGDHLRTGVAATFASWSPYVLVIAGIVTLLLVQSAYQLDRPTVTLPVITVSEPLISTLIGVVLFGERIHLGLVRGSITVAGLAVVVYSLVVLGRDPALARSRKDDRR